MGGLIGLLMVYYDCDAIGRARPMGGAELARCQGALPAITIAFTGAELAPPGSLARYAQDSEGYARLKAWEADNPDLTQALRAGLL